MWLPLGALGVSRVNRTPEAALERLVRVRRDIEAKLAEASYTELADWPFGYPWSILDILHHLAASDVHISREIAMALGRPAPLTPTRSASTAFNMAEFTRCRAVFSEMLLEMELRDWQRILSVSSHPLLAGRTISEAVDFTTFHEFRHGEEIDRHLAATRAARMEVTRTSDGRHDGRHPYGQAQS